MAGSGFAGLSYELVWTRSFAAVLGTEMAAVLGVLTGFFAGVGLGALAWDRRVRAARRPGMAYAMLEVAIAAWAVASVWLVPWVARVLPGWLGPSPGPGALWLAGFALPALLLLPATAAMGGTLAALDRLTAAVRQQARVGAWVYGANTAGAVAGALVGVLVLLPALGVSGTVLAMAAVNVCCAAGALWLGDGSVEAGAAPAAGQRPWRVGAMLAATGLLGIAFEVLVVRVAAQVLQNTVLSFAFLLACYLAGTAAGALAWHRVQAQRGRGWADGATPVLAMGTAGACLGTALLVQAFGSVATSAAPGFGPWAELGVAACLFLLPAACMGALFACLAQQVRDVRGSLGWAVGLNSLGAAAAPPLVAWAVIPTVGAWAGLVVVGVAYAVLGLCWATRRRAAMACGVAIASSALLLPRPVLLRVPPGGQVLQVREGPTATASVVVDADGTRYLDVNGHFRMGGTRTVRADWRQAHLPMLLHPDPRSALLLGVGTGATAAGAAAAGLSVTAVELSPEVVALLPAFADSRAPAFPVQVADARRFVATPGPLYDLVVADLFHPALDGTGALYTVEHFLAVRQRLQPGGLFCQWLPLYQLEPGVLRTIIRTFLAAYPDGRAFLGNHSVQTPMLALCGGDARAPDGAALAPRMSDPALRPALQRSGLSTPADVLGLHVADAGALARLAGPGALNTDDRPLVALAALRSVAALGAHPAATLLDLLRGLPAGDRTARARLHFLEAGAAIPPGLQGRALIEAAAPGLIETIRLDPGFDPAYGPLLAMAQLLGRSDPEAARRLLRQVEQAAPEREEARRILGPP